MSFITGCMGPGRTLAVLAQLADDDGELVEAWSLGLWADGDWRMEKALDFRPVSVAPQPGRPGAWVVLGCDGEVLWVDTAGGTLTARADHIAAVPGTAFTSLRAARGGVAAVAMGRLAFHSSGNGWQVLGALPPAGAGELVGFEVLLETPDALYAAGWKGEIWRLDGDVWERATSPTSMILTSGTTLPGGDVLFCGRLGTLVTGRGARWSLVQQNQTDEDFWSVTVFRGRVFVASLQGVRELHGDRLELVDDGLSDASYYHLSSNDELMLSVGSGTIAVTDGDEWTPLL